MSSLLFFLILTQKNTKAIKGGVKQKERGRTVSYVPFSHQKSKRYLILWFNLLFFLIESPQTTLSTTMGSTYAMGLILPSAVTPPPPSKTYAMGLIVPSAVTSPSPSKTYAMGLILPKITTTTASPPFPEPEPVNAPGDLTPENGLYSLGTAPVYPENSIPEPENRIPSPEDVDICKNLLSRFSFCLFNTF